MPTRPRRVRAQLTGAFAALACLLPLAACGSSDYTFVTNKGEQTYFKVPANWSELDNDLLRAAFADESPDSMERMAIDSERWVAAFDSSANPSPVHLSLGEPVTEPTALAVIQDLTAEEGSKLSLDDMRNLFEPVVGAEHDQAAEYFEQQDIEFNVEVLADAVLAPTRDVHGIRIFYNIKFGDGPLETRDLTVFVSNDRTKLYMFLVRCTADCFLQRADELIGIADSFTVVGRD